MGPTSGRALAIAVASGLALLASGCSRAGGDDAKDPGRAHVETTCAACHAGAKLDTVVAARVGDGDPQAVLDPFLKAHHAPDATLRAAVIAHLRERLAARRTGGASGSE